MYCQAPLTFSVDNATSIIHLLNIFSGSKQGTDTSDKSIAYAHFSQILVFMKQLIIKY